jgi:hypothetical protein
VEYEQRGEMRAEYGAELFKHLSADLLSRFGRGFSERNLEKYRAFYLAWPISPTLSAKSVTASLLPSPIAIPPTPSAELTGTILPTPSAESVQAKYQTASGKSQIVQIPPDKSSAYYLSALAQAFPLSWSHYVRLLSVKSPEARAFYETEA